MVSWLNETDAYWLEEVYQKVCCKIEKEVLRMGETIPYIAYDGVYRDLDTPEGIYMWTNGFWPGILWQMFWATGKKEYADLAGRIENRMDEALNGFEGLYHDVGFMYLLSAVANYRITGNERSKIRGLHAAAILAGRYNPTGEYIRAWNQPSWTNADVSGWFIIDSMMNLPLLYWAEAETGDPRYADIASRHADTVKKHCLREDGSSNHIVVLNPLTGEFVDNPGGQGYGSGSSWSRGQAWALYGFALSYRYTGKKEYLNAAKRCAHYCIANMALNEWTALVDFRAPHDPERYDSTAGAAMASGLLELAEHVDSYEKSLYQEAALKILKACEKNYCNWNPDEDGILDGGTVLYHGHQNNVPIIYGDYFFIESVMRLYEKHKLMW